MAEPSVAQSRLEEWGEAVTLRLQDPGRVRVAILALVGLLGLGAVGLPMYDEILTLQKKLDQERRREALIQEHDYIESQAQRYRKRINQKADLNWWIEFILNATRDTGLKVVEFSPTQVKGKQAQIGALSGVYLNIEVFGPYLDVLRFIGRLENQKEVVRVTKVSMTKETVTAPLKTHLTIGVLMRKTALPQSPGPAGKPAPPPASPVPPQRAGAGPE